MVFTISYVAIGCYLSLLAYGKNTPTTVPSPVNSRRVDPTTTINQPFTDQIQYSANDPYVTITEDTTNTYTSVRVPTMIWITVVVDGKTNIIESRYHQQFTQQYPQLAEPASGSIGKGDLLGEVGVTKSVSYYDRTSANIAAGVLPKISLFELLLILGLSILYN